MGALCRFMVAGVAALSCVGGVVAAGDAARPVTGAASAAERMIVVEREIDAPASRVWRVFTTPEGWEECVGVPLKVELRPGGPYEVWFAPDAPEGSRGSDGCKVLSYLPERMLSFSWNTPPNFPTLRAMGPLNIVVIEFEARGEDRTHVRITHHGWPSDAGDLQKEWDGAFGYFSAAWPMVLEWVDRGLSGE